MEEAPDKSDTPAASQGPGTPAAAAGAIVFEGAAGGGGGGGPGSSKATPRSVKRPRPVKSCLECRKRKLRCDRLPVCSQCVKSQRTCRYSDPESGNLSDGSDNDTAERPAKRLQPPPAQLHQQQQQFQQRQLQLLQPNQQQQEAQQSAQQPPQQQPTQHRASIPSHAGGQHQDSPSAFHSSVPINGSDTHSVHAANGFEEMAARLDRLEKLISGKAPAETTDHDGIVASPLTLRGLTVKAGLRTRIFGQNSTKVLINLFDDARELMSDMGKLDSTRDIFTNLQQVYKALQKEHSKALRPMTVYVDSMMPVQKRMADVLPKKAVCDRLLEAYIGMSEGLYRVIHIPTFRYEYEQYWEGKGCHDAFLPRLLAMMSIASRFETESRGLVHDRSDGVHTPTACALVRNWLDSLKGKQLVDINTLHTEILLLHAQRTITPRHQDSWVQLGYIVRMAMTMGLHRDPSEFPQLTPFFGELRRRLWYTVMDMDLHVSLSCNLPCNTREGEYTCRPPRNLNDEDLYPDMKDLPDSRPMDQFTTSQLQAYAASTLPWRLKVSAILSRLDFVQSYADVLATGQQLERMLDDINCLFPRHAALDPQSKYKQWRDRALLDMHVRRPLLDLYRPFALSAAANRPAHIHSSYLKSCMVMLTYMDELDPQTPGYRDVVHMYLLVLKHDIIQAAFSVCYYIKNASDNIATGAQRPSTGGGGQWQPGSALPPGEGLINGHDGQNMWSVSTLISAVERTLESLVGIIRDSSSDLKEIFALAVVLNSVQAGTPEEKVERIKESTRHLLDVAYGALGSRGLDGMGSLPMTPALSTPQDPRHTHDPYGGGSNTFLNVHGLGHDPFSFESTPGGTPTWESFLDYWNPLSTPMEQT